MSTQRHGDADHPDYDPKARGPQGRPLCRYCLAEVPPRKRTFCGQKCVEGYFIRQGYSGPVRAAVLERDEGICAICGVDAEKLERVIGALYHQIEPSPGYGRETRAVLTELGFPGCRPFQSLWQADHIVPVVEGGGGCDLENYRTLCTPCHKAETRELAGRMRARRILGQLRKPA